MIKVGKNCCNNDRYMFFVGFGVSFEINIKGLFISLVVVVFVYDDFGNKVVCVVVF